MIVYLGQKTRSSYDATHKNTLNASMASLRRHMLRAREADAGIDRAHERGLGRERDRRR